MSSASVDHLTKKVICPGRVNLIGDHTDYAHGLAMPVAINLFTQAEFYSNEKSNFLNVTTETIVDQEPTIEKLRLDFNNIEISNRLAKFIASAVDVLGVTPTGSLRITSTLPIGAGLSSSASFVIALLLSFKDLDLDLHLAKLAQDVEHKATSAATGLLDQLAIIFAKKGTASLINFSDNSMENIRIPEDLQILIIHSGIERQLSNSNYTLKVNAVQLIEERYGKLNEMLPTDANAITDPELKQIARHIVSENRRVIEYSEALMANDVGALKEIISQSHNSLSRDYSVSLPEIDHLVSAVNSIEGVIGARLTGGGYGGCIVALTQKEQLDQSEILNLQQPTWFIESADAPIQISQPNIS